jgi:hypothetical protein
LDAEISVGGTSRTSTASEPNRAWGRKAEIGESQSGDFGFGYFEVNFISLTAQTSIKIKIALGNLSATTSRSLAGKRLNQFKD